MTINSVITANRFAFPVVGVSFIDTYPANVLSLQDSIDYTTAVAADKLGPLTLGEGPTVVLIREPLNPYDANAIEVHVPTVGKVGHVPKEIAARLAPSLDSGTHFTASVAAVNVNPEHPDRPGLWVQVTLRPKS